MFSDRGRTIDRTGLNIDELMAARPLRTKGPLAFGSRLPGGERTGRVRAQGSDFESISPYVPGDDVRQIDWRSTARSGQTQMRRFSASAHRGRCIVLDLKPDLEFGTQDWPMLKTTLLAAAWLAWEARLLNEPVGLALGTDAEMMRPRSGERNVERLIRRLWQCYSDFASFEEVPLVPLLERVGACLGQGDDLCLVGDMSAVTPEFQNASLALSERRNLTMMLVEDPMFRAPVRPGKYPIQSRAGVRTVSISATNAQRAAETFVELKRDRRRALMDCGWQVVEALDLPLIKRAQA